MKERKILRYVPTRWLSLGRCLQRIIEEWDSLKTMFKKHNNNDRKSFILENLEKPITKLNLQFLNHIIKKLNELNAKFQAEDISSYALYEDLRNFFKTFSKIILKPAFKMMSFEELYAIDLTKEEDIRYYMNAEECYQDFKTGRFKYEVEWDLIPNEERLELMENVRELIIEVLNQAKFYLPFDDEYINLFKVLKPSGFDRYCWIELLDKFPNLISKENFSDFIYELDCIEEFDYSLLDPTDSYEKQWSNLHKKVNCPLVSKLARILLTIPVSSASIERTFSQLRLVKTSLQTCLSDETLESCLLIHQEKDLPISEEIVKLIDGIKTQGKDEDKGSKKSKENTQKGNKQSIINVDPPSKDHVVNSPQLADIQALFSDSESEGQGDQTSDERLCKGSIDLETIRSIGEPNLYLLIY